MNFKVRGFGRPEDPIPPQKTGPRLGKVITRQETCFYCIALPARDRAQTLEIYPVSRTPPLGCLSQQGHHHALDDQFTEGNEVRIQLVFSLQVGRAAVDNAK
mgnify:CR=1 FL=1